MDAASAFQTISCCRSIHCYTNQFRRFPPPHQPFPFPLSIQSPAFHLSQSSPYPPPTSHLFPHFGPAFIFIYYFFFYPPYPIQSFDLLSLLWLSSYFSSLLFFLLVYWPSPLYISPFGSQFRHSHFRVFCPFVYFTAFSPFSRVVYFSFGLYVLMHVLFLFIYASSFTPTRSGWFRTMEFVSPSQHVK